MSNEIENVIMLHEEIIESLQSSKRINRYTRDMLIECILYIVNLRKEGRE